MLNEQGKGRYPCRVSALLFNYIYIMNFMENITEDLRDKYNQLLIDNNLNPDDYYPHLSYGNMDFSTNTFTVTLTPMPVKRIQGIKVTELIFLD